MNLTDHFTLEELCHTNTGIPNIPTDEIEMNLTHLAKEILEPTRIAWGPMKVNCAYRSPEVNKAVGGVANSQHATGEAADIKPLSIPIEIVYDWITKNLIFGQCILEEKHGVKWIHVSSLRASKANNECLVAVMKDGKMQYKSYEGVA